MNKSDVERDSPEWVAVSDRLHRLLAPIVRRLTREPGSAASPQALRTADQVRRILARALRLLESGQLFESQTASAGEGDGDQLTLDSAAPGAEKPEPELDDGGGEEAAEDIAEEAAEGQDTRLPRPRPARPGGTGTGIGEIVVRALDPRLRSAMVVEDGVRRVVINSRFPLYEVRKGDLWYQLETALREVCVTIPEATVPEFERKANELMLVSIALTDRRRRRSSGKRMHSPGTRRMGADCLTGARSSAYS